MRVQSALPGHAEGRGCPAHVPTCLPPALKDEGKEEEEESRALFRFMQLQPVSGI